MKTLKLLFLFLGLSFLTFGNSTTKQEQDLKCLTQAIYFEARGESIEGKIAVANVVMNRKEKWKISSVCQVTSQKRQFGWWRYRNAEILEKDKWEEAHIIAILVYIGDIHDITEGAVFFHERKIHPGWTKKMIITRQIGLHVFYALS